MKYKYYLGVDDRYKYYLENVHQDEYGWRSFIVYKERYNTCIDNDYGDLDSEEKFNFETNSENEFGLKKLIQLENDKFSIKDRLLLVEVGKSIEALITVHKMCEFGCYDLLFDDSFPEECEILKDKELMKKVEEKIWKLWNLAVKFL